MLFSSLFLCFFCILSASVHAAEETNAPRTFLKQVDCESESSSSSECDFEFFRTTADLRNFDFFGNEQTWRPDRTIPVDSLICIETGNTNVNFRKFAGLLLGEIASELANEIWWLTNWSFERVNELKAGFYPVQSSSENCENASPFEQIDRGAFFPRLKTSEGHAAVLNDFVIDLFRAILPNFQGSQLDGTIDMAGMVMFLALKLTGDLEGYFYEIKELYAILKDLANGPFDLRKLEAADEFSGIDRQEFLEELFRVAVTNDLLFTLELFYALEMVDFSGELLKFVLKTAMCPAVLNRFFDFVDWKGLVHVPEMWISTPVSRLHFMYESYPEYLKMLYEYEPMRVDWSIAEIPEEANSKTILGKLLSGRNSIFDAEATENISRFLLREILNAVDVGPGLISHCPDRDLLDECLENERTGLKQLVEYFDALPLDRIDGILAEYLKRIVETWGVSELAHTKVFKLLLKRHSGASDSDLLAVLNEAYELISSWTPKPSRSTSPRSTSPRSASNSRSSFQSGEFFRSIFRESSSSSLSSSLATSPVNCRASVEMLKLIVEASVGISSEDPESLALWSSRLADLETI